jgi:uncharacterized protein YueI
LLIAGEIIKMIKYIFSKAANLHPSVLFYTFHKCASSLFSSFILKNAGGLKHVDYAAKIWNGDQFVNCKYDKYGKIYGPIRLTANSDAPVYKMLVEPFSTAKFVSNKNAIFFIRDPRDVLISEYYSYRLSHPLAVEATTLALQLAARTRIENESLSEYCLRRAPELASAFRKMSELHVSSPLSILIKYEEMVNEYHVFIKKLLTKISLSNDIIDEIYKKSRPQQYVDESKHKRSGAVQKFHEKIDILISQRVDEYFSELPSEFRYPPAEFFYQK